MRVSTTCLTAVQAITLLQHVGKVFQNDDGVHASVVQLVLQLARVYSGLTLTTV